jgi:hypothetical protein
VLHNRYLPDWVHRLANGAIGGVLSSLAASAAVRVLGAPLGAFWCVLLVALLCTALNSRRFSLVEGCAGDLGYDELLDDGADEPDDGALAETFDC